MNVRILAIVVALVIAFVLYQHKMLQSQITTLHQVVQRAIAEPGTGPNEPQQIPRPLPALETYRPPPHNRPSEHKALSSSSMRQHDPEADFENDSMEQRYKK